AIDLAFLNAADAGVFVACSAGNEGPAEASIRYPGGAPWVTAVGASSQTRFFQGSVSSSDKMWGVKGASAFDFPSSKTKKAGKNMKNKKGIMKKRKGTMKKGKGIMKKEKGIMKKEKGIMKNKKGIMKKEKSNLKSQEEVQIRAPLVDGTAAGSESCDSALSSNMVSGKIVLCDGIYDASAQTYYVMLAGGLGVINYTTDDDIDESATTGHLPYVSISNSEGRIVKKYIASKPPGGAIASIGTDDIV
ncbi:MAG: PA domain-containing protein, partial [Gaiellaceae bacterium]